MKTLRTYLLNITPLEADLTEIQLSAIEKAVGEYLADTIGELVNLIEGKHWGDFDPELVCILEKVRRVLKK